MVSSSTLEIVKKDRDYNCQVSFSSDGRQAHSGALGKENYFGALCQEFSFTTGPVTVGSWVTHGNLCTVLQTLDFKLDDGLRPTAKLSCPTPDKSNKNFSSEFLQRVAWQISIQNTAMDVCLKP